MALSRAAPMLETRNRTQIGAAMSTSNPALPLPSVPRAAPGLASAYRTPVPSDGNASPLVSDASGRSAAGRSPSPRCCSSPSGW